MTTCSYILSRCILHQRLAVLFSHQAEQEQTLASIIFHSPETKRVDPAIPFVVVVDDPTDLLAPFTSLVTQEDPFDFSFSRTSNSPL